MIEEAQEIIEILPADGFGPPAPVELIVENSFSVWQLYLTSLEWVVPAMMLIAGYIVLRHLIWGSLKFNYHHYLQHGEFVLLWGDDGDDHTKKQIRIDLAKELKIEADFASWFAALAMSLFLLIMWAATAYLWPITCILVIPLMIVRLIGYRKRQKIEFTQKLKGEHLT